MTYTSSPMTMNVAQTVDYLVEALGGTATYWTTWLSNDRKTGRTQQLLTEAGPGRPRYARSVVDAFIDTRRASHQQENGVSADESSALRKQGGRPDAESSPGRRFNPRITAMTNEEEGFEGGEPYVMLITTSPLALYTLNAAEARRIAARLISAADCVDQSSGNAA